MLASLEIADLFFSYDSLNMAGTSHCLVCGQATDTAICSATRTRL